MLNVNPVVKEVVALIRSQILAHQIVMYKINVGHQEACQENQKIYLDSCLLTTKKQK